MANTQKMSSQNNNLDANNNNNGPEPQLNLKLPIVINGSEKYATGLTRRTTIDDVKFAMLSASDASFNVDSLTDFGVFEKWQGNERILDGKIKVYKLVRLWQSLPGDQLSQVKFMIKKRTQTAQSTQKLKLVYKDTDQIEASTKVGKKDDAKRYAFCTLSPTNSKTWSAEKAKRKVQREFIHHHQQKQSNSESDSSDIDADLDSCRSESSTAEEENTKFQSHKRYASIKRFNRSRKSTIRHTQQIKKSFIDLVKKQNEIIDRQLNKLGDLNELEQKKESGECLAAKRCSKSFAKYLLRSKSCEKTKQTSSKERIEIDDINENDIRDMFHDCKLDDKQTKEYSKLCKDYLKLQQSLVAKVNKVEELQSELNDEQQSQPKVIKSLMKANKKLQASLDTSQAQSDKLSELSQALNKIDDVICLKEKFIHTLEQELQRLENNSNELIYLQKSVKCKSLPFVPESTTSSTTSSSVFTSISSISSSQSNNFQLFNNPKLKQQQQQQMQMPQQINQSIGNKGQFCSYGDNESDTGISSANSDDFSTQLETLV